MSSPSPRERKTRRSPLQGSLMNEQGVNRKVPFKRNLLQEIRATLSPDDSLNPSPQSQTATNIASTSKSGAASKQGAAPTDFELMAAMMQRITMLEYTVRSQVQEMDQKDRQISGLEEQLRSQEESGICEQKARICPAWRVFFFLEVSDSETAACLCVDSESAPRPSSRDDLKKRCLLLQNKVQEMENFLSDYGLMWVGDGETSDSAESRQTTSSGLAADRGFQMNFDLVLKRIRELNVLAGEGESFVQATGTGAKLAKKDPIQLKLYGNGIVMFDGPFRSYQERSTQQCMQDLMDGYFPSELEQRFPDGMPFEVHDRRDEEFLVRLPWDTYPGDGQAVCGQESTDSLGLVAGRKLTTDRFLSKLPKMVVKAGNVIHIRGSLRRTLQGSSDAKSSSSEVLIDTPALQTAMARTQTTTPGKPAQGVLTLKLKSEDGNHTYVMKMSLSETVGQLRGYLDKHRGPGQPAYDIIGAYPRRSFSDDGRTLQSCGLSANAALLLRRRPPRNQ
uniref:UBX domain-containing protein 11 n=1 Tax=Fundulus heteroclitus TaxID=8078 RepID=A0A3Q2UHQ0_FUNHE